MFGSLSSKILSLATSPVFAFNSASTVLSVSTVTPRSFSEALTLLPSAVNVTVVLFCCCFTVFASSSRVWPMTETLPK